MSENGSTDGQDESNDKSMKKRARNQVHAKNHKIKKKEETLEMAARLEELENQFAKQNQYAQELENLVMVLKNEEFEGDREFIENFIKNKCK